MFSSFCISIILCLFWCREKRKQLLHLQKLFLVGVEGFEPSE